MTGWAIAFVVVLAVYVADSGASAWSVGLVILLALAAVVSVSRADRPR